MATETGDPRETLNHPRMAATVKGHDSLYNRIVSSFQAGRLHHAWLLTGPKGIGKATLAYAIAKAVLRSSATNPSQTIQWIHARSHPDLFVLERQLGDTKTDRLKSEISVASARDLITFFGQTSGTGSWRVAIVDAVDELNMESANALLKLVEEPPTRCLLLLVCHNPGLVLRTLKSRCMRCSLAPLPNQTNIEVLNQLEATKDISLEQIEVIAMLSAGSPGVAIQLIASPAAVAFQMFSGAVDLSASSRYKILKNFTQRGPNPEHFNLFCELLLAWTATRAKSNVNTRNGLAFSEVFSRIMESMRETNAFNFDRKQALNSYMHLIEDALKAA